MAALKSDRWWMKTTAIAAAVFLVAVYLFTFWGWWGIVPKVEDVSDEIAALQSLPTATATVNPADSHPFPLKSQPLTADLLTLVDAGWALVAYDSGSGVFRAPDVVEGDVVPDSLLPQWSTPGPRYLYLVDPRGGLYEAANLGSNADLELVAWLPDRSKVVVQRLLQPPETGVTLHEFDLLSGDLGPALKDVEGNEEVWLDPEVLVARNGVDLWVASGTDARSVHLVSLRGGLTQLVTAGPEVYGMAENAIGDFYTVQTYLQDGLPAAALMSFRHGVDGFEEAEVRGFPDAETDCFPAAWPAARQLLLQCANTPGETSVVAFVAQTNTFVETSYIPWEPDDGIFEFNGDTTRVAVTRVVFDLLGGTQWVVSNEEAQATDVAWTGTTLLMWGNARRDLEPGSGVFEVRAHDDEGDLIYTLQAVDGAAGFVTVLGIP